VLIQDVPGQPLRTRPSLQRASACSRERETFVNTNTAAVRGSRHTGDFHRHNGLWPDLFVSSAMSGTLYVFLFKGGSSVAVNAISCGQIDADKSCAKWLQDGSNELTEDVVGIDAKGRASLENPDNTPRNFRD
jgi:hypothetical protein